MNAIGALSTTAPNVSSEAVAALVRRLYGIDGSVESLAGGVTVAGGKQRTAAINRQDHQSIEPPSVVDFRSALGHIAGITGTAGAARCADTDGHACEHDRWPWRTHARGMLTHLDGIRSQCAPPHSGGL
jgi:hypothetical protein